MSTHNALLRLVPAVDEFVTSMRDVYLVFALAAHAREQVAISAAATARLIEALNAEAPAKESRLSQLSKREHLNVADASGRRHGRTYGPSRDGWVPVKWLDTGERVRVREEDLLLRYTVQSVGYIPKSQRDARAAVSAHEESEVFA